MKLRNIWGLVVPAALVLGACKKKEPAETTGTPAPAETAAESGSQPEPAPEVPALSPEERADKLGFARHLPQDTAAVISLHNGTRHASKIKASKLWQAISGEEALDLPDVPEDESPTGPAALFAREFTIAVGAQAGEQSSNLIQLNRRLTHFQMRAIASAAAECAESGDFSNFESAMGRRFSEELFVNLIKDPESGAELFEKMNMPPLYIAFGTTEENRDAIAQQLASSTEMLAFFGDFVEPVEVERNGSMFAGNKVSGEKLSALMTESREPMDAMLDAATVDKLIAAVAKKDLVILSERIGDYAVFFLGSSLDDLVFSEAPGDSVVACDAVAFCDAHLSKELAGLIYGKKEMISQMMSNVTGLADIASGLQEGLAGSQGLGDTRDLQALLRIVGEREAALRTLMKLDGTGTIAFIEDGLKIESYGGIDTGKFDWEASNRLAGLQAGENVALFTNATAGKAYSESARAYLEALMETAYAVAMKVAELPLEDDDMLQYREMAGMFDMNFRKDAVAVWNALSGDFTEGLGQESALIIDLNGTPPPVPGVPQEVVNEGKFPRITLVAPVTERAKLASAWQQIDGSAANILEKIGEMRGTPIPMQKPLSSERDGFTTWFFPVPFFTEDFLPSVTLGDEWFAASTSKNQALDLLAKAGSGESTQGVTVLVNFDALREFAKLTTDVLEKNKENVVLDEDVLEGIRTVADALEDFERLDIRARKEGGQLRTSIHLKTR
ncbi:MAG TPA: hypothetical protein VLO11_15020 [Luteolibacter sp.]|nr:hypothetical protein [Luteolibacter sp.]